MIWMGSYGSRTGCSHKSNPLHFIRYQDWHDPRQRQQFLPGLRKAPGESECDLKFKSYLFNPRTFRGVSGRHLPWRTPGVWKDPEHLYQKG